MEAPRHKIAALVSDSRHSDLFERSRKIQRILHIFGGNRAEALQNAKEYCARRGYKVYQIEYVRQEQD